MRLLLGLFLALACAAMAPAQTIDGPESNVFNTTAPASGGGGGWTPSNEVSVVVWFQANQFTNSGGSQIVFEPDSSGNGNNGAPPAGVSGPTYVPSIVNGKAVMGWNGNALDNKASSGTLPATWAFVLKTTNGVSANQVIWGAATNTGSLSIDINAGTFRLMNQGVAQIGTCPVVDNTWYSLLITYDGSAWAFYTNGVAGPSGTSAQTVSANWSRSGAANGYPPSVYFSGYIAENLMANAVWTTTQRSNWFAYTLSKYGF